VGPSALTVCGRAGTRRRRVLVALWPGPRGLMVMGMARVACLAAVACVFLAVHPAWYGHHNTRCTYPDNLFNGPILDLSAQQRHPFHIEWRGSR
jgi:hypothetical protein